MYRSTVLIIVILCCGFSACVGATSLKQLQQQCDAAREARLAPERQALIDVCIEEKSKTPEKCHRFYADYGAGGRTAAGAGRVRLYNDLPECEALYQAEKNSSKR